ncbi:BPSL0067 family protein [Elioraea sp.]|uniref:BPSL0067 family protein n=1 Tax=Elioraea sp. TaxID=2185103 RepID=UPI003F70B6CF
MPKGSLAELQAMARADKDFAGKAEMLEFYKVENLSKWKKRATHVGNGQCPILPQLASGAPKVKFWRKGPIVKGNAAVPEGAVIAAGWNADGKYPNRSHGNHAAIYLRQTAKGLVVLDQWLGKDIAKHGFERTLAFGKRKGDDIVNGGDYFHVVVTDRFITEFEYMMMEIGRALAATGAF